MKTHLKGKKLDLAQLGKAVVDAATVSPVKKKKKTKRAKNPAAVALGKLGGSKGGKIRAERLSAERRKEIAQKAAEVRWQSNM